MSPSAEPASNGAAVPAYLVPADLLDEGEVIILALKPSMWFVLVVSLPILASAAVVAAAACGLHFYRPATPLSGILFLAVAAALGRMCFACWQWLGRTYVLTNRRIICLRGLVNTDVASAALVDVKRVVLAAGRPERLFGAGSIFCLTGADASAAELEGELAARSAITWAVVGRPQEVHEIVQTAVSRAHHGGPGPIGE